MDYLREFFIGVLFCNCIPHLVSGLQGRRFPTPFAMMRSVKQSSALLNFVWGAANLFLAVFMLERHPEFVQSLKNMPPLAMGFMMSGMYLVRHFSRVTGNVHAEGRRVASAVED